MFCVNFVLFLPLGFYKLNMVQSIYVACINLRTLQYCFSRNLDTTIFILQELDGLAHRSAASSNEEVIPTSTYLAFLLIYSFK